MDENLVRYSRAGDVFHYRWAALRCLHMIYPNSSISKIIIEGSQEKKKSGEYVIDVSEYYSDLDDKNSKIVYYQLKHSTVQKDSPFTLSNLKNTIEGFAKRFINICNDTNFKDIEFEFCIISNRKFASSFKTNVKRIANGDKADDGFTKTIKKYTKLDGNSLAAFCKKLTLNDKNGDYITQGELLQQKALELSGDYFEIPHINSLTELIAEKALPDSDGTVYPEEVLRKFGVSSKRELFPAPSKIENTHNYVNRSIYADITQQINASDRPCIVHAPGGVGKTVYASHLKDSISQSSVAILYDCFGAGSYRNRSQARHGHYEALVQIANELSLFNLCKPIITNRNNSITNIMRSFLERIEEACANIKEIDASAQIYVVVDAADNAEQAAKEYNDICFAHELIRETFPSNFKLIMLCRTERVDLVDPENLVKHIKLDSFSFDESKCLLQSFFPGVKQNEAEEFHRLTNGNPRVQNKVLDSNYDNVIDLLLSFRATETSVEDQINSRLEDAIENVKKKECINEREKIDSICIGLATLPPFIPIDVLSKASGVSVESIISFISDFGSSLLLVGNSAVQFKDEPTETWFRNKYGENASEDTINEYIKQLMPLAETDVYIAETVPYLLLKAKRYDELISLALSSDALPKNNPTISRNIKTDRISFALKASVKLCRFEDAVKLALLSGVEMSGKERQYELFAQNIDLIKNLQTDTDIQSIAYRHMLRGAWKGSENLYSASLLSTDKKSLCEARNFLRSAERWLHIYFSEAEEKDYFNNTLKDEELSEFAFALGNIIGVEQAVSFLCNTFKNSSYIFKISALYLRKLIDNDDIEKINHIMSLPIDNIYFVVALTYELLSVGKTPTFEIIKSSFESLCSGKQFLEKAVQSYDNNEYSEALISFFEICAKFGLPHNQLLDIIEKCINSRPSSTLTYDFCSSERASFLRLIALKSFLSDSDFSNQDIMPQTWLEKYNKRNYEEDKRKFESIIKSLLPWYKLRICALLQDDFDFKDEYEKIAVEFQKLDELALYGLSYIPYEIYHAKSLIFVLCNGITKIDGAKLYESLLSKTLNSHLDDLYTNLRFVCRNSSLEGLSKTISKIVLKRIEDDNESETEIKLNNYIQLARAVLASSSEDASVYFNMAVETASRFGDEIVQRWEAVCAVADRLSQSDSQNDNIAYRFIRCAELVGDHVAREKYWDRDNAVRICAKLSPATAIAALSRWRDRSVGRFCYQIHALASTLVENSGIPSKFIWPLSFFYDGYDYLNFAQLCIDNESNPEIKQKVFDSVVDNISKDNYNKNTLEELKLIANRNSLYSDSVSQMIRFASDTTDSLNSIDCECSTDIDNPIEFLFYGIDLLSQAGINLLYDKKRQCENVNYSVFMDSLLKHIPVQRPLEFIRSFLSVDCTDFLDSIEVMERFIQQFGDKISVERGWKNVLESFGYIYHKELTPFSKNVYYLKKITRNSDDFAAIKNGMMHHYIDEPVFDSAQICFGFIELAVENIDLLESKELLDFALNGFEQYMPENFGDGDYESNALINESVIDAIAGFIWCALGSPKAETRWKAVHSILEASKLHCVDLIDSLISRINSKEVGSYGHSNYPFYSLHAKQYLLIALRRIAVDSTDNLQKYSQLFETTALQSTHILIQKLSSEICIEIENNAHGTYDKNSLLNLQKVTQSPYLIADNNNDIKNDFVNSIQTINITDDDPLYFFFEEDWLKSLGRVFGLSSKVLSKMAIDVILNEVHADLDYCKNKDPRSFQWHNESCIYTSHGTYPLTDIFRFYLSYHAMLCIASKLLKRVPIVSNEYHDENPWNFWLQRHCLTNKDGKLLSDRRDPLPLIRNEFNVSRSNWENSITDEIFFSNIFSDNDRQMIIVDGYWSDGEDLLKEEFFISSAFVPVETTQALITALLSFDFSNDYALPNFSDLSEYEDENYIDERFAMQGWIVSLDAFECIDRYDPLSADINYPPYEIGEPFLNILGAKPDKDNRYWYDQETGNRIANCEIWCSNIERPIKEYAIRNGKRISVKLEAVLKLCKELNMNLLLKISAKREIRKDIYNYERREYKQPTARLFVIRKDGTIKIYQ